MKAVFCLLLVALFKGTNGDDPLQNLINAEQSNYDARIPEIDYTIPDFTNTVEERYSSVKSSVLNSGDFDLICHLNSQHSYHDWYSEVSAQCAVERAAAIANSTFWHEKFAAEVPELRDLFNAAVAVIASRSECTAADKTQYHDQLQVKVESLHSYFHQLSVVLSHGDAAVPYEILYGFHYSLESIFAGVQNPNFDAMTALTNAEMRHLTMDRLTVLDACKYARWYIESNIYAQYTNCLDRVRSILEKEVARGAYLYTCTGV